jgi:hypothetical protein
MLQLRFWTRSRHCVQSKIKIQILIDPFFLWKPPFFLFFQKAHNGVCTSKIKVVFFVVYVIHNPLWLHAGPTKLPEKEIFRLIEDV